MTGISKVYRFYRSLVFWISLFFAIWIAYSILGSDDIRIMPKCIFRLASGYDCPLCGVQRMIVCLIEGDFRSALLYNPYILIVSPYITVLLAVVLFPKYVSDKVRRVAMSPVTVSLFALLMLFWWVLRNTDSWQSIVNRYL